MFTKCSEFQNRSFSAVQIRGSTCSIFKLNVSEIKQSHYIKFLNCCICYLRILSEIGIVLNRRSITNSESNSCRKMKQIHKN